MKKAIMLHMDAAKDKFRECINSIHLLYMLYQLNCIGADCDIVVHLVNGCCSFLNDLKIQKLVVINDKFAASKGKGMLFSRIYGYMNPSLYQYDELNILDCDFWFYDQKKILNFLKTDVPQNVHVCGDFYKTKDGIDCVWCACMKFNMRALVGKITEEVIDSAIMDFNSRKVRGIYDEDVLVRIFDKLGLKTEHKNYKQLFKHYWFTPSLNLKLELATKAIEDEQFAQWLRKNNLWEEYRRMTDVFFKMWIERHKKFFEQKCDINMQTDNLQKKFDDAKTLLDKVHVLLDDMKNPEVMYNKLPDQEETIDDIALIQCFYGTDIARIRATTQALEFNLQMTAKPSTWVFVECQRKKSECAFQWLKRYGVKYVFVPMKPENEGIMLKHPLWNIGFANCTESKLCFVDSDVVMCNSDWIKKAAPEFDSYDVLSLASHQYCQADENYKLYETIGYKWVSTGKVDGGHVGFTLGLTRKTFKEICGLDPAIILDDIHTYHKILGDESFKFFEEWTKPFALQPDRKFGYNVELGYADNIACHVWHGDAPSKYDDLTKLMVASGVKSMSDMFDYSRGDELPAWKTNTAKGMALSKTILKYYEHVKKNESAADKQPDFDIVGEYKSEMKRLLGEPDEKHPLFVCTVVKDRFGLKLEDFTKFRNRVEDKFMGAKVQPVVLFFTDCKKYDFKDEGFNVVPIKNYNPEDEFAQCLRKDLKYPRNVVIYYIPFGLFDFSSDIWVPDGKTENPDGSILISR